MSQITILLADEQPIFVSGLRAVLATVPSFRVVAEALEAVSAREAVAQHRPTVVVLDWALPDAGGVKTTEAIKRECPETHVLALSTREDPLSLRVILDAGASGYVSKRASGERLLAAVRTVASGGVCVDPELAAELCGVITPRAFGHVTQLSKRESEVVRLTAQGLSAKEIAAQLAVSPRTLEMYKGRAMEKLGLTSRADLVRYALRCGWLRDG